MNDNVPEHLRTTITRIRAAPIAQPALPWSLVGAYAVGGLDSVGFAPSTDVILVTSTQGRGVYDCLTGVRLARDRDTQDFEDPITLEADGIGPLEGKNIRMSGLNGGGLPKLTLDGWSAERMILDWPAETLLLVPPGSWIYGDAYGKPAEFTKVFVDSEIRAWGFSPTGRSLVSATSSDLTVYSRK